MQQKYLKIYMFKIIKNNGKTEKENSFGDPFKKSTLCIQKVNKTTHKAKNNKKRKQQSTSSISNKQLYDKFGAIQTSF